MALKKYHPTSAGTRHKSTVKRVLSRVKPEKALLKSKSKITGRNNRGVITIRHRGGGEKRRLRIIDFKRAEKAGVMGKVDSIQYDPNRSANLALIIYTDGDKRYILAPKGLIAGDSVMVGETAEIKPGNALPLRNIPIGTPIHNLEIRPGKGGQMVRGAGVAASIQSKEGNTAAVLLPSKEVRLFSLDAYATIGQVGNDEHGSISLGKAGRKRHLGRRPEVRGSAMNPKDHPHGGGEGRSGVGLKAPKTPWGKRTMGVITRKKRKYSKSVIIKSRRQK
jgi:large subunit ribosomal protein L2